MCRAQDLTGTHRQTSGKEAAAQMFILYTLAIALCTGRYDFTGISHSLQSLPNAVSGPYYSVRKSSDFPCLMIMNYPEIKYESSLRKLQNVLSSFLTFPICSSRVL